MVGVSCGGAGDGAGGGSDGHDHAHAPPEGAPAGHGTVPGEPAVTRDAARSIRVVAVDTLEFRPARIEVAAGEAVTFVVTNRGKTEHEFVLGDADYQAAHEMEMSSGDMPTHEANAMTLAPGATERVTWRFTQPGEVLYGCHVAGHYDGGMVGTIYVSA